MADPVLGECCSGRLFPGETCDACGKTYMGEQAPEPKVVACIAAGTHLTSCDDDGYCNHCGYQDGWDHDTQEWEQPYKDAVEEMSDAGN